MNLIIIPQRFDHGVANDLKQLEIISAEAGKLHEALEYFKEALKIFQRLGSQPNINKVQDYINSINEEKK